MKLAYLVFAFSLFGTQAFAKEPVELKPGQSIIFCSSFFSKTVDSALDGITRHMNQQLTNPDGIEIPGPTIYIAKQPFSVSAPSVTQIYKEAVESMLSACVTVTKK